MEAKLSNSQMLARELASCSPHKKKYLLLLSFLICSLLFCSLLVYQQPRLHCAVQVVGENSKSDLEESGPARPFAAEHDLCASPSAAITAFREANSEGSDKGTPGHSYELMYGPFLAPLLDKPVSILEIGVDDGKSLKLWQRLFPKHTVIVGIGYGQGSEVKQDFKRQVAEKHFLYTGSQADAKFLDRVKTDLGGIQFDLIIDDGSHVPWHQIFTLENFFQDSLKDGGMYIIEDIETSYWDAPGSSLYGYEMKDAGAGKHGNVVEKLKGVADTINRGMLLDPDFHILGNKVDTLVSHIMFSLNIIVMWKKDLKQWESANIQEKHIDNYQFTSSELFDLRREEYKKWKAGISWEIAGMNRVGE